MIVCIVGPTGVGKTKLSIELAKYYNGIIINADSMQIYKELNIGTAKIKEEEKEGIKHYLFDIKEPTDMYTVYDYQKNLRKLLDDNKEKNMIESHMFPMGNIMPKYKESWTLSLIDKGISTYEQYKNNWKPIIGVYIIFVINMIMFGQK